MRHKWSKPKGTNYHVTCKHCGMKRRYASKTTKVRGAGINGRVREEQFLTGQLWTSVRDLGGTPPCRGPR